MLVMPVGVRVITPFPYPVFTGIAFLVSSLSVLFKDRYRIPVFIEQFLAAFRAEVLTPPCHYRRPPEKAGFSAFTSHDVELQPYRPGLPSQILKPRDDIPAIEVICLRFRE